MRHEQLIHPLLKHPDKKTGTANTVGQQSLSRTCPTWYTRTWNCGVTSCGLCETSPVPSPTVPHSPLPTYLSPIPTLNPPCLLLIDESVSCHLCNFLCLLDLTCCLPTLMINTLYALLISLYPLYTPSQSTLSAHSLNLPSPHTLSPCPLPSHFSPLRWQAGPWLGGFQGLWIRILMDCSWW